MHCCRLRWIASKSDQLAAVKALREQSGAPISDVKAALVEADWKQGARAQLDRERLCCRFPYPPSRPAFAHNVASTWHADEAMDMLRKKGLAAAGKKVRCLVLRTGRSEGMLMVRSDHAMPQASRTAAQGLIGFARQGDSAAVLVEARLSPAVPVVKRICMPAALQTTHAICSANGTQVNSETDFVARNDQFTSLVSQVAQAALRQTPADAGAPCSCSPCLNCY